MLRSRRAAKLTLYALTTLVWGLILFARHDARGPLAVPLPDRLPDLGSERVLVLASPEVQDGAWHGLQIELPARMRFWSPKGLFVEAAPWARSVFEAERAVAHPSARPRWWAIRTDSREQMEAEGIDRLRERFRELGIGWILAREPVSTRVGDLAIRPPIELGHGFRLYRLSPASLAWRADPPHEPVPVHVSEDGDALVLRLGERPGRVVIAIAAVSDWRVERGVATLGRTVDGDLEVTGRGEIHLRVSPGADEWAGLMLGAVGWSATFWLGSRERRRRMIPRR
jgi:hypothetical protein